MPGCPRSSLRSAPVPAFLVSLVLGVAALGAQTNDEVHAGQQFSMAPPGARSLAMGGAFSGLADDATAAYANPAGLLWLRRPEVSVELRSNGHITRFPDRGSASGAAQFCPGMPSAPCLDTSDSPVLDDHTATTEGVAFASYVHLFRRPGSSAGGSPVYRERWRLALFRHALADYLSEISSEGPFLGGPGTNRPTRSRLAAIEGTYSLRIATTGVSLAREIATIGAGRLSGGVTLGYSELRLDSRMQRYLTIDPGSGNAALPGPVETVPGNETNRQLQTADDGAVSWSAGVMLRASDASWSVGAVYRRAPAFRTEYRFEWGQGALDRALETGNPDAADPAVEVALSGVGDFRVPDSWSLGASKRFGKRLRASVDWTRVEYSQLRPRSNVLLNVLAPADCGIYSRSGRLNEPPIPCTTRQPRFDRFAVDDGDEWRLGFEVVLGQRHKVALRAGAWRDPDHQLRFELEPDGDVPGSSIGNLPPPLDRLAARFLPGEDEWHVTGGVGIVPSRQRFQIDLAADVSERVEIVSVAAVYRW